MRIAKVIGTVTCSQLHPALSGGRFKVSVPLSLADLLSEVDPTGEDLVVYDELGAGLGQRIMLSEGAEAAQPFYPDIKPIDAYNAGILDDIQLDTNMRTKFET